ncbi:sugar phosphate isomerase/epimerase family protein [Methylobacterium sp. J-077]|uniref:sugar phosphate isomerase/epimerase family protein n=1 Tax=Methylobacterium sp. J-077 TaxID=2836656 RepID=UPI001FBA941A|nr:sugar phosphate isomerase/epimerase family protein [Methylobacterium sp. J-077]MCJ2126365.1 sugar phosphate isomerase/epimerase [Methylobacterium sp. J-077]
MNRRSFLATGIGLGLGLAVGRASAAPLLPGPSFINTVLLGGSPEEKLRAARKAGFAQVELWTTDVARAEGGAAGVRALVAELGLGLTDYQVLLDFDGAPGDKRAAKRAEALTMLDTAAAAGASTVLAPASTDPACDPARITEDLIWLVDEARRRGLRIAYEGLAWSTVNPSLAGAWATIRNLDPRHAGIVVDSYHLFVRGETPTILGDIPPERIFLVQFSDIPGPVQPSDYREVARHARLLPGDGRLPLASLIGKLSAIDYRGPVGLEVFNDRLKAESPEGVAKRAYGALQKLLSEGAL